MLIDDYENRVLKAADFLKKRLFSYNISPKIGFLTGTGLSSSIYSMDIAVEFSYKDIPHFPVSTVESHQGRLIFGTMSGKQIIVMQGRFHLYEGYSPLEVAFPIRVMQELGVKHLIISNASGGLNLNFSVGDIMVICDHINLTGHNPLIGKNLDRWGVRFPDMTAVYDKELAQIAVNPAENFGITTQNSKRNSQPSEEIMHKSEIVIKKGVYAGLSGPSLETPAETRFLKAAGADAVGFSTVMEAIVGVHAGMKILGLAAITNINNPDLPEKSTIEDIIKAADHASKSINAILQGVLEKI